MTVGSPVGAVLVGAVLVGGGSTRFGSDKSLAPVGDTTLGGRVVTALRSAGVDPLVAVGGTSGHHLGLVTVPDRWPGEGPLGGLATVLLWARRGRVLVVPCDLPRLGRSVLGPLLAADQVARDEGREVIIAPTVDGNLQYFPAIWPAALGTEIRRLIETGERRMRAAFDVCDWEPVEVPPAGLADADTPADLERLAGPADG